MEIRIISHADLARCPRRSLEASHYYDDGTYRCPRWTHEQAERIITLLDRYGEAKFGDEWWPGHAEAFIGDEGIELERLLR